jgi:adenine-specific DNA-methyltransferase
MILNTPYNKESFDTFLKDFLPDYQKDERPVRTDGSILTQVTKLGASKQVDVTVLEVECEETDSNRRIAITQAAFKILRSHSIRNAIVAFHDGNDQWRLSLLTSTLEINDGRVVKKDSNPRRYSYLLGVEAKTVTPYKYLIEKGRVEDIKQLQERFSVEVVNKQFYASMADLFTKLVGGERGAAKYPGLLKIKGQTGQNVEHQEFAVRLIGRVIFSWFLKEKKSTAGMPIVPNELLSLDAVANNADYYHSILEPLFFELLNKRIEHRHESLREAPFSTVPYLNGGLFSPQHGDFYSQNSFDGAGTPGLTHIPDEWFKELFGILNQYNFTVDENTSYDVYLSIDPEMLGRIFENLLAEINPETGESARKSTGSFYTPREIVDYMVDSSLLEFLKSKTGAAEQKLKALISWGQTDDDEHPLTEPEKEKVVTSLATLTILDPACGSGAFPIGILQKVVYILQQADPKAEIWLENQLKSITSPELRRDIEDKYRNENYDYLRKLGVIRESIFGVDIQTIATEIAKLRCFLTLVIEEDVNDDLVNNRGIRPLPNLDFKFVTANSLLPLPQGSVKGQGALFEDVGHVDALRNIRNEYFIADADHRKMLRADFAELQKTMLIKTLDQYGGQSSGLYNTLMRWEPFENKSTDWFDAEWMFGLDGFDIVIANPPYIHLESMKDTAAKLYKPLKFTTYEARGDIYSLFYERGIESLKDGGILTFITSNKWMRAGYGKSLRDYFIENTNPLLLIDLGGGVFESATVDTSIIVLRKEKYAGQTKAVSASKDFSVTNMSDYIEQNTVSIEFKTGESWAILSPIEQSIKAKIEAVGTPLKDWDIKINRGVLTGLNEAFIIDKPTRDRLIAKDPKSAEIIRPILRGKDIKRNSYDFKDLYLITSHNGHKEVPAIDINDYPAVKGWLDSEQWNGKPDKGTAHERLASRTDKGRTPYNLRDCKYMDDFNKRKIVWADIAKEPTFVTIDEPIFFNNTCYMIVGTPSGLTDILNSKMIEWYFPKIATDIGNGGARYFKQFVELIRVPQTIGDRNYSDEDVFNIYGLNDKERNYIHSVV